MIRVLLAFALWCLALVANAHEAKPAYLRATEISVGEFQILWKQPSDSTTGIKITPRFPSDCTQTEKRLDHNRETISEQSILQCPFRQGVLSLQGLENAEMDSFVQITYLDGSVRSALLKPSAPSLSLGGPPASPVKDYLGIGVEHIIYGWDHLLFVIGLTLLVGGRKVWGVATAFTLAHSLTLAATALGGITLPSRPVEILIAGSIVLLALEIMRKRKGELTLGARRPFLIAFAVGFIHGFGFAGALADIGLPQGTELFALLLFNLGVELGQFAVIGVALAALWALMKLGKNWKGLAEVITSYAIAGIAMFWVFQRITPYVVGI